jgi:HSP20 family protein
MRSLTRWEPTSDLNTLATRMDRLFDELMGRGVRRSLDEGSSLRGSWVPAIDVREKNDAIEIRADLPGLKPEDVEVTVDNGVLSIRGERRLEETQEGESWHRVERAYGVFERTFSLPSSVDATKIEARFKNGEMRLVLPKREESKPRSVKVKVETE